MITLRLSVLRFDLFVLNRFKTFEISLLRVSKMEQTEPFLNLLVGVLSSANSVNLKKKLS